MKGTGAILLLLLVGCRSAPKEKSAADLRPVEEKIASGQVAFRKHCQECHPNGKAGLGPTLEHVPGPDFMIKSQIRLGLGAMPSFNKKEIPAAELMDLVAYVNTLRKGEKTEEKSSL